MLQPAVPLAVVLCLGHPRAHGAGVARADGVLALHVALDLGEGAAIVPAGHAHNARGVLHYQPVPDHALCNGNAVVGH